MRIWKYGFNVEMADMQRQISMPLTADEYSLLLGAEYRRRVPTPILTVEIQENMNICYKKKITEKNI